MKKTCTDRMPTMSDPDERIADILAEWAADPNARTDEGLVRLDDDYLERIIRRLTNGREGLARPEGEDDE